MQSGFYKSRRIAADIAGFVLAAFTGTGEQVAVAADQTKPLAGVTDSVGGKANDLVDVQMTEIADLRFGGTIGAGDAIMAAADGTGRGIKATKPAAGVTHYCIGFAQGPGLANDIGKVLVTPFALIG